MTPDQILRFITDGGAVSGFAALCIMCFLWSQKVTDLASTLDKRLNEMNRRTDQIVTATTELTLALISQAPIESRPIFTAALKAMLEKKGDAP